MEKKFYFCSCFDKDGKSCFITILSDSEFKTKFYLQDKGYIINGLYEEGKEWIEIFNNSHIDMII